MELLRSGTKTWIRGPDLPDRIKSAVMIIDPVTNSPILLGGKPENNEQYSKNIYKLEAMIGQEIEFAENWSLLEQKLKQGRDSFVAFTVPDEYCLE